MQFASHSALHSPTRHYTTALRLFPPPLAARGCAPPFLPTVRAVCPLWWRPATGSSWWRCRSAGWRPYIVVANAGRRQRRRVRVGGGGGRRRRRRRQFPPIVRPHSPQVPAPLLHDACGVARACYRNNLLLDVALAGSVCTTMICRPLV